MRLSDCEIEKFSQWLAGCGAEVLAHTSEWEIIRVKAQGETLVAYKNKRGDQTWPIDLRKAWSARKSGFQPQLGNPVGALRGNKRGLIYQIAERDGWECWYCADKLIEPGGSLSEGVAFATIEEVCPRQIGGPTHIGNQVIACSPCNQKAANMAVADKVRLRDASRLDRDKGPS